MSRNSRFSSSSISLVPNMLIPPSPLSIIVIFQTTLQHSWVFLADPSFGVSLNVFLFRSDPRVVVLWRAQCMRSKMLASDLWNNRNGAYEVRKPRRWRKDNSLIHEDHRVCWRIQKRYSLKHYDTTDSRFFWGWGHGLPSPHNAGRNGSNKIEKGLKTRKAF